MSDGPASQAQVDKMVALKRLADNAITPHARERAIDLLNAAFTQFVWGK